jgi:eukaryotic translation initiation factor 2C
MSLDLTDLVKRPGAGKVGKPVRVRANFFEVTSFPTQNIHHYDVTIDPADAPPAVYRKVWKSFEDVNGQGILTGIKTVFDGRKNVFSPKPLPLGEEQAKQFEVKYHLSDDLFIFLVLKNLPLPKNAY